MTKEITIRTEIRPGDIGDIIRLHGEIYNKEYGYGIEFETYVAEGLCEFIKQYNSEKERLWLCEHQQKIVGSLLLMNRGEAAQLRYYLIIPEFRGKGIGTALMTFFLEFLNSAGYKSAFLWTTNELHSAAHLYKKFGFQQAEEKISTTFGRTVTEQKYVLEIGKKPE